MVPEMNNAYDEVNGKPTWSPTTRSTSAWPSTWPSPTAPASCWYPNIKGADQMNFREFWQAYEAMVKKARNNELTVDDFAGTTASLTNPGGIGTSHSVPRLMTGQGVILGVGSIDYPPEFQAASDQRIKELGVSKITTLTSTYDHRVIQGATSGEFLKVMHELIIGDHDFYDEVYLSLRVPYLPLRWASDDSAHRSYELAKGTRVLQLINAYRSWGHLMADIDPLEYQQRSHPELELEAHGLSIWDLEREFPVGVFGGHEKETMRLKDVLAQLRTAYCGHVGVEYMHIADTEKRRWLESYFESPIVRWGREEHLRILDKLNEAEIFETFLQTKFVGQKRFSLEGAESTIVLLDEICDRAANEGLEEVAIGMPHRGRLNVLANIVGKSYGQIFREFEGNIDPNQTMGTGDVKYHLGAEGEFTSLSRRDDQDVGGRQPEPPRGRQPGRGGHRTGQTRPARRPHRDLPGGADPAARRRVVLRPGRRLRDPADEPAARLQDRRHDPHRGQQPGRLHHGPGRVALVGLLHRRRQGDPGADLPRQRRRPRGGASASPARVRVPPGLPQGRRHRPRRVPPPRPQRGRRPELHAAEDVRPHRAEALGAPPLHRGAHRPRRHLHRGRRGRDGAVPQPPGGRVQGGQARPTTRTTRPTARCRSTRRSSARNRARRSPGRRCSASPTPR